jgi:hypothetical protein
MAFVYLTMYKDPDPAWSGPRYYIGSTSKSEEAVYFGSVSSKRWKAWWKKTTKLYPERFTRIIISRHASDELARKAERQEQEAHHVVESSAFFNLIYCPTSALDARRIGKPYDRSGEKNPMYGKRWSKTAEQRAKHSTPLSAHWKYDKRIFVYDIGNCLVKGTRRQISDFFGVPIKRLGRLTTNPPKHSSRWSWVRLVGEANAEETN